MFLICQQIRKNFCGELPARLTQSVTTEDSIWFVCVNEVVCVFFTLSLLSVYHCSLPDTVFLLQIAILRACQVDEELANNFDDFCVPANEAKIET